MPIMLAFITEVDGMNSHLVDFPFHWGTRPSLKRTPHPDPDHSGMDTTADRAMIMMSYRAF